MLRPVLESLKTSLKTNIRVEKKTFIKHGRRSQLKILLLKKKTN